MRIPDWWQRLALPARAALAAVLGVLIIGIIFLTTIGGSRPTVTVDAVLFGVTGLNSACANSAQVEISDGAGNLIGSGTLTAASDNGSPRSNVVLGAPGFMCHYRGGIPATQANEYSVSVNGSSGVVVSREQLQANHNVILVGSAK